MNKFKFLPSLLCAVFVLTVAANAQQQQKTKIESSPLGASVAPLELKNDATAHQINQGVKTTIEKDAAGGETSRANKSSRRQTYVRPSKDARLKRYLSDAFGIPAVIGATFGATINQIGNNPPEWEKNVGGFGKRFASSYATNVIRNSVSYGSSEAFKLDNKFDRRGGKDIGKRIKHAFLGSYTTRTKTGKRIPDFPYVTGTYAAAIIANEAWYPDRYSYRDGLRDGTISLGVRFGVNLLREFVFPR